MVLKFVAITLICFASVCTYAQKNHYQFSHLDITHGLSNNQVNNIYKDSNGFMWFGTLSGLDRYDGYQFKVFKHDVNDSTTLSDNCITDIFEGPGGFLWIRTLLGYDIYDPNTEKFERNENIYLKKMGLPELPVNSLIKAGSGKFLFLMDGRNIYSYNTADSKGLLLYTVASPTNTISAFGVNGQGECWLVHHFGLSERIDIKTGRITAQTDLLARIYGRDLVYYNLFIDHDGELWVFTSAGTPKGGVVRYNPANGKHTHFSTQNAPPALNNNLVASVHDDEEGIIWISTDHGGINLYDKKSNTMRYLQNNIADDKSLSQNSIKTSYRDDTGIMWIGTFKKGINYFHKNIIKFPVYRHHPSDPNSLSHDDVNRFAEDASGNIWIGTNGGGLLYFNRANNRFTQYLHEPGNRNSISNNIIVSLYIDKEQNLWIGSYFGGLDCRLKNGRFIHYRHDPANPNSISDNRVWEIYEDSKNNLWIGTLDGGLNRFDRKTNIFYHYQRDLPNSIHSNYVASIMEDNENKLWIGTDRGIEIIDIITGNIVHCAGTGQRDSISHNNVVSIFQDSRGLIWLGTRDGLNVFNRRYKKFQVFRVDNGLADNSVLNILEDDRHQLWVSTTKGITKIKVIPGKTESDSVSISCVNYDELDGLQGAEFNESAAFKSSKGELMFGGAEGFNIFNPDKIYDNNISPIPVLTDLQIFNKSVRVGEKINGRPILQQSIYNTSSVKLKHNENIITIEFAALHFSNPNKIKYAYKLEGFNDDWVYIDGKTRKAIYTNLDPGIYTFRLKASNEAVKWTGRETSFQIIISPPFWRTWAAYIVYMIIISAILFFGRKIIIERARMRFQVEHQRQEAERIHALDLLKTKFFTNVSHEFRTPLSLILSPLDKLNKKIVEPENKKHLQLIHRNAKRLLNLINQLLDFRKMEIQEFPLVLSYDDIVRFVKDITESFSDISEKSDIDLSFYSDTASLETYFDKDKLEKILFNLLSNAFKYTALNGKVKVELMYDAKAEGLSHGAVIISVSDTGIGIPAELHDKIFERYFQHELPGNMHNYGTGIGLAITKEFVKLHNGTITVQSDSEKGTRFIVTLPVREEEGVDLDGKNSEISVSTLEKKLSGSKVNEKEEPSHFKKNTILLVEDNEDFRFYLKDNLKYGYHVIEALNGKDGWDKVQDQHPDIVVSDIMMPVMNGLELSRKIKSDTHTSHIPVIFLTAMTSVERELEGFQAGANDYITKPFTFEILNSRIKNLFSLQEQMRKKFQKLVEINPADFTITPVDEEFMKRAVAIVEKNMGNPGFSVDDLSKELFLSRVSLYRKLLALTGKTPIEFIRVMRLKRAAQLLSKSKMTISEIAFEVGFNSPKLFARYFKEEFNVIPSQYIPKHP